MNLNIFFNQLGTEQKYFAFLGLSRKVSGFKVASH